MFLEQIEKSIGRSQLFTFKYQFCHIWIPPNLKESLDFGLYLSNIILYYILNLSHPMRGDQSCSLDAW
jgi:hypothetical protein